MPGTAELSLRVLKTYTRSGCGIARIDYDTMDSLNLFVGDFIGIRGKRRTVAKCWPLYAVDEDNGLKGVVRQTDTMLVWSEEIR